MTGPITATMPTVTQFDVATLYKRAGTGADAVRALQPGERAYVHPLGGSAAATYCLIAGDRGQIAAIYQLNGSDWQPLPANTHIQCSPQYRYALAWSPGGTPGAAPPPLAHPLDQSFAASPDPAEAPQGRLVLPRQLEEPILSPPVRSSTDGPGVRPVRRPAPRPGAEWSAQAAASASSRSSPIGT